MTKAELLLVQLKEECAEVIVATAKSLRFGPEEVYEPIGVSNAARIEAELCDVIAVAEVLQSEGVISGRFMKRDFIDAKKIKINQYLSYSKELGILK